MLSSHIVVMFPVWVSVQKRKGENDARLLACQVQMIRRAKQSCWQRGKYTRETKGSIAGGCGRPAPVIERNQAHSDALSCRKFAGKQHNEMQSLLSLDRGRDQMQTIHS